MTNVVIKEAAPGFWTLHIKGQHVGDYTTRAMAEKTCRRLGWFPPAELCAFCGGNDHADHDRYVDAVNGGVWGG